MRLGVMKNLMERDSLYAITVEKLRNAGAEIVEYYPENDIYLEGLLTLMNLDMKKDLETYITHQVKNKNMVNVKTLQDVIDFNQKDSLVRIPYGQGRFDGIIADTTSYETLAHIKKDLMLSGRAFFEILEKENLDAVLSLNSDHAAFAAVAEYPALTIPMGYKLNGQPAGLTFIGKPYSEILLLQIGKSFEDLTKSRKMPQGYVD